MKELKTYIAIRCFVDEVKPDVCRKLPPSIIFENSLVYFCFTYTFIYFFFVNCIPNAQIALFFKTAIKMSIIKCFFFQPKLKQLKKISIKAFKILKIYLLLHLYVLEKVLSIQNFLPQICS